MPDGANPCAVHAKATRFLRTLDLQKHGELGLDETRVENERRLWVPPILLAGSRFTKLSYKQVPSSFMKKEE